MIQGYPSSLKTFVYAIQGCSTVLKFVKGDLEKLLKLKGV